MLNSRSKYEQIGVSNTFLRHTQKKLFTFKNSPVFFGPPCRVPYCSILPILSFRLFVQCRYCL